MPDFSDIRRNFRNKTVVFNTLARTQTLVCASADRNRPEYEFNKVLNAQRLIKQMNTMSCNHLRNDSSADAVKETGEPGEIFPP